MRGWSHVQAKQIFSSDNGLAFSARRYTATVKAYGLRQEFITSYTPEQNGLVERSYVATKRNTSGGSDLNRSVMRTR